MKKKNILMIGLSLCLIAVIAVSGTLAYFTDTTDASTNTFTMGQVEVVLDEDATGEEKANPRTDSSSGYEYSSVMPGDTLKKHVTIAKSSDSADCYVAVLVEAVPKSSVPDEDELLGLVKNAVGTGNWTVRYLNAERKAATGTDSNNNGVPDDAVYSLYVYNDILTDTTEQTLFTEIKFPDVEWGNSYANASFDLVISAYAVQSDNFLTSTDDEGALVLPTNEEVADWFAAEGQLAAIEADNQTTTGTTEP